MTHSESQTTPSRQLRRLFAPPGYRARVFHRDLPPPTPRDRVRAVAYRFGGPAIRSAWALIGVAGAIGPASRAGKRFGSFGEGSIICFPAGAITNESSIHIGARTLIATNVTVSAGWGPKQPDLPERVLGIGDRCLIGRGSSIVAHRSIEIGNDVWTGPNVYITDMNHGYEDLDRPISEQCQGERPVAIGNGSWLGSGAVVLPGVTIGAHVVIGAGSVVTSDLPDRSVAVGAPARVVRFHDGTAWQEAKRSSDVG